MTEIETIESLKAELKASNKALKKAEREIARLNKDNEILSILNEKASHLREVIEREQEKRVFYNDMLLQNSPDIFLLVDCNLTSLMATDSFYTKSPYDRKQVEGGVSLSDLFSDFLSDDHRKLMLSKVQSAMDERVSHQYEERMLVDGNEEIFEVTISPAKTAQDKVIGAVLIFVDITELVFAKERAESADKAKSNFLANMSHEIRTPMNAINGMSEFIIRDTTDMEAKENALQIKSAASSLLAIINDILDFSKIEAGKMEIIDAPYQPSSLIIDVASMINIRLSDKPVELVLDVDENIPCELYGDEIRIKQILINILNNAVKFTNQGKITVKITSHAIFTDERGKEEVRLDFSVSDTGIGIREDDLKKLFSSFTQVDTKRNRSVEGTGLGLAISRRLVNAMHGEIKVESVYGEGTTFKWSIINGVENSSPMGKLDRKAALSSVKTFRNEFIIPKAKILIVDDNLVNLKVAEGVLKPYHADVTTASSGAESVELTNRLQFDIIFMDHMMPVMDGVEAMQKIRKNPKQADSVIIALTANAISGVREKYISYGFQDFLAKPIEMQSMDEILRKYLSKDLLEENTDIDSVDDKANDVTVDDEILKQVWREGIKKLELMPKLVKDEDWKNYTIEVHALKSVAAAIGEDDLSEIAKKHEAAGKENDSNFIKSDFNRLYSMYSELVAKLDERYSKPDSEKNIELLDELSADEWKAAVLSILEAFDEFDLQRVKDEGERLLEYKIAKDKAKLLEKLIEAADDFAYDTVEEIINELKQ